MENKVKKFIITNKKTIMYFVMMLVVLVVASAQQNKGQVNQTTIQGFSMIKKVFGTAYWFFCSTYMKVICGCCIVWIGVKMYGARGQQEAMKTLIWWLVGTILIGGGSTICGLFFEPSGNFAIQSLTSGEYIFEELK